MSDPGTGLSSASTAARSASGRARRRVLPRRGLVELTVGARDPLGILDRQNSVRVPELIPLRVERMSQSPFAFYRGTAALMAADLAQSPHSGILVASCGDAHVSNFGFYASPQRRLVFDLNDFDEAAWAPWEWDVKRLVTSIVIAGQATSRDEASVRDAATGAVRAYARAIRTAVAMSPTQRYFSHFDVDAVRATLDKASRKVLRAAIRAAQKRTGERAADRTTTRDADGRLAFVEDPPRLTHVSPELEERVHGYADRYAASAAVDIRMLLQNYTVADVARRVVGVGSVGTRCHLVVLEDGDGNGLLLQAKEAGRSVLAEHGGIRQPRALDEHVARFGEGGRVVGMQRILQAVSDPFLGHLRSDGGVDLYVRQFHDMKGGIEIDGLEDEPFAQYAQSCAIVLARAHAQSPAAAMVAGYLGDGRAAAEPLREWAHAYADLSRADYAAFVAAR
nr:DUF2252 domain-containing protein [Microbacterium bovistercoris]